MNLWADMSKNKEQMQENNVKEQNSIYVFCTNLCVSVKLFLYVELKMVKVQSR